MSLFSDLPPAPLVSARDMALAYGGRRILSHVSFDMMPGEMWFVIGPNGAGKSTLLKAMLGLLAPIEGDIGLARSLDDRSRIGFVPQRIELPATVPVTIREYVDLGFAGSRLEGAVRRQRIDAALERVGLSERRRESMAELSGGQRQRAAIARALVCDPLLLVVDEPTTGLDLVAERDLLGLIRDLNRERHMTVVFVAHDLAMVTDHASHVALLANGSVHAGTIEKIMSGDRLSAAFSCPITVASHDGRLRIAVG